MSQITSQHWCSTSFANTWINGLPTIGQKRLKRGEGPAMDWEGEGNLQPLLQSLFK